MPLVILGSTWKYMGYFEYLKLQYPAWEYLIVLGSEVSYSGDFGVLGSTVSYLEFLGVQYPSWDI